MQSGTALTGECHWQSGAAISEDRLPHAAGCSLRQRALDYKIDNETWEVLRANALSIDEISAERIREELARILARSSFEEGIELHRVDCESSHAMLDNMLDSKYL